jgi:hypothetical protein
LKNNKYLKIISKFVEETVGMKRYLLIMSIIAIGLLGLVAVCLCLYRYETKNLQTKTVLVTKPAPYFPLSYIISALVKE